MAAVIEFPHYGPSANIDNCGDRAWHRPNYHGQCTNNVPGQVNAPLPAPGIFIAHYLQLPCPAVGAAIHAPGQTVCGHCTEHIELRPWYKLAKARIVNLPPPNVTSINNAPGQVGETRFWRGFLTRMCRTCEYREQYLIGGRLMGIPVFNVPSAPTQNQMQAYPVNTCTCLYYFSSGRLCFRHRKRHWEAIRDDPLELCQRRDDNREWLRTLAKHPVTRVLMTANQNRLEDRKTCRNGRTLRACRCGEEVTTGKPQVYQCMACQGIKQVESLPQHIYDITGWIPPFPHLAINSSTLGNPFDIPRHGSPATC